MKIEQAYSLDIGDTVDAELAYDYYWAGAIINKKNFECPSPKCSAPITCANLDKLRQDMKVDPYFKAVEDHHPDCDLVQNIDHVDTTSQKSQEKPKARAKKSDKLPDIFELSRPKSHFEKKEVNNIKSGASSTAIKNKKNKTSISPNTQPSRHYAVRAFVSKYIKYKAEGSLAKHHIDIKGYSVSYGEMFVEISSQDIHMLSKDPRIYFGKAFIDAKKESDYIINFTESFFVEDTLKRPSIYIAKNLLDEAFTKKLSEEKFADLSKKNHPSVWCFVYAIPQLKTVNDKLHINFKILNMDFIDLREKV